MLGGSIYREVKYVDAVVLYASFFSSSQSLVCQTKKSNKKTGEVGQEEQEDNIPRERE
jgi:hypothetical protein